jgi:hypothetical protein
MGERRAYPVPDNWQGPMQVASSPDEATLPDCAGNQATVHQGVMADDAVCPCTCDPPQAAACRAVIKNHADDSTCTNAGTELAVVGMQCVNSAAAVAPANAGVTTEVLPSACSANGGGAQLSEPTWTTHLRVCEVEAEPPPGGQCLPAPAAPFQRRWCIVGGGDQSCPEGYTQKSLFHSDYDDTRACSGNCTCDVGGVSCAGTVSRYSLSGCANSLGTWVPGSCNSVTAFPLSYDLTDVTIGGMCTAVPPASVGEVAGKNPVTVCCTP